MNYLDQPCPRCQRLAVIPPTKKELETRTILVECDACSRTSRYLKVGDTYRLSIWGKYTGRNLRRVSRWLDKRYEGLTSREINAALDKVYNDNV